MICPPTPHLRARRGRRHYYLNRHFKTLASTEGRWWLEKNGGIVVYVAPAIDPLDMNIPHVWIAPRCWQSQHVPITVVAPEAFTHSGNEYVAHDLITWPVKPQDADPWIAAARHMRKYFGWLKKGDHTGRTRVYDIWPQIGQRSPIWQHEPKELKLQEG